MSRLTKGSICSSLGNIACKAFIRLRNII